MSKYTKAPQNLDALRSLVEAKKRAKQSSRTKQSSAGSPSNSMRTKISRAEKIATLGEKMGFMLVRLGKEGFVKSSMEEVDYMSKSPNDVVNSGVGKETPKTNDTPKVTQDQLGKMEPAGVKTRDGINPPISDDSGTSTGDETVNTIDPGVIETTNSDPTTGKVPRFEEKMSPDQDVNAIIEKMSSASPESYFRRKMSGLSFHLSDDDHRQLRRMKVREPKDCLRVFVKSAAARNMSVDAYLDDLSVNDPHFYELVKEAEMSGAMERDEIMVAKEGVQDIVRTRQELPDPAQVAQIKGVSTPAAEVAVVETAALIESVNGEVAPSGMGGEAASLGGQLDLTQGAPPAPMAPPAVPASPPVPPPAAPPVGGGGAPPMGGGGAPPMDPNGAPPPPPGPGGQVVQASVDYENGNLFHLMSLLQKESALSDIDEDPVKDEVNVVNPDTNKAGARGTFNDSPKEPSDTSTIDDPSPDQEKVDDPASTIIDSGPQDMDTQQKEKQVAEDAAGLSGSSQAHQAALDELDVDADTDVEHVGEEYDTTSKTSTVNKQIQRLFPGS